MRRKLTNGDEGLNRQVTYLGILFQALIGFTGFIVIFNAYDNYQTMRASEAKIDSLTQQFYGEISKQTSKLEMQTKSADERMENIQQANNENLQKLIAQQFEMQKFLFESQNKVQSNIEDKFDKLAGVAAKPAELVFKFENSRIDSKELIVPYSTINKQIMLSSDVIFLYIENLGGSVASNIHIYLKIKKGNISANTIIVNSDEKTWGKFDTRIEGVDSFTIFKLYSPEPINQISPKDYFRIPIPVDEFKKQIQTGIKSVKIELIGISNLPEPVRCTLNLRFQPIQK